MLSIHRLSSSSACSQDDQIIAAFGSNFHLLDAKTGSIILSTLHFSDKSTFPKNSIRAMDINASHLVLVSDDKMISCWDLETLSLIHSCTSIKRANSVKFSKDGKDIIVGDKAGDVYSIVMSELEKGAFKLLGGHVSMILDLCFSVDGRYLITAERDEKIRVSRYPLTYGIENFCLGHKEYVSRIHIPVFAPEYLVSGGGDTFLILWNFIQGKELHRFEIPESTETDALYSSILAIESCAVSKTIAIVLEKRPFVLLLSLDGDKLKSIKELSVARDVLSVCFDKSGNLIASFGPTVLSTNDSNVAEPYLGFSAYNIASQSYGDIDLTSIASGVATLEAKEGLTPDYYEVGKLGKASIKQKLDIKQKRIAASDRTSKKVKT